MTMEKEFCPGCETERSVVHETIREVSELRGESIEADQERFRCTVCGTDFVTGDMMDRNLDAVRAEYRIRHGILSPEEIVDLRKTYGASQKAFGTILGFGELTINSYEQGSLPTDANNNLLRLMRNPSGFRELFETNKNLIGPTQRKRIESRLGALHSERNRHFVSYDSSETLEACEVREPADNGYAIRSIEKMWALVQLLIAYSGTRLYKMQILKLAFYADFSHFRRHTVAITGWEYAAIDHGPVPNEYKAILNEGERRGYFSSSPDNSDIGDLFNLPNGFSLLDTESYFSKEELCTINEVSTRLRGKTASELREMTHREKAWIETPHAECISYEWAMELTGV